MHGDHPVGLFITGNNTEVGKTWVTCAIARAARRCGLTVGCYKPAASGAVRDIDGQLVSQDLRQLQLAAGFQGDPRWICPQVFEAPLAPHLAARAEGKEIDRQRLRFGLNIWRTEQQAGRCDLILVEGAGGLLSPISEEDYVADLALEFGLPLIVVAANRLGVINETLLTLSAARTYRGGIPVAGVVLNDIAAPSSDASQSSNHQQLVAHCDAPILADLSYGQADFTESIDWLALANQQF